MGITVHDSPKEWLDLKQAEQEFSISKRSLWLWISNGKLPAYKPFKKKTLVKRSDIVRILEATRVGADLDRIVSETLTELESSK